jgi:hypothetical protein
MRRPRHKLQVSTFPFLAVLLCAMGALILFLLVMDRRAKIVARNKARDVLAARTDEQRKIEAVRQSEWEKQRDALHEALAAQHQDLRKEQQQVYQQLAEAGKELPTQELQVQGLRLAAANEEAKLQEQQAMLQAQLLGVKEAKQKGAEGKDDLARLGADIADLEKVLDNLKALKKREQQTYSVVPYSGKNGDDRKPIYVECGKAGLIFHPDRRALEGIELTAAALRGEVERRAGGLVREKKAPANGLVEPAPPKGPYVLFLIRPDGIASYYLALSYLRGFQMDFGYEVVDQDWVLEFAGGPATPSVPAVPKASIAVGDARPPAPAGPPIPSGAPSSVTGAFGGGTATPPVEPLPTISIGPGIGPATPGFGPAGPAAPAMDLNPSLAGPPFGKGVSGPNLNPTGTAADQPGDAPAGAGLGSPTPLTGPRLAPAGPVANAVPRLIPLSKLPAPVPLVRAGPGAPAGGASPSKTGSGNGPPDSSTSTSQNLGLTPGATVPGTASTAPGGIAPPAAVAPAGPGGGTTASGSGTSGSVGPPTTGPTPGQASLGASGAAGSAGEPGALGPALTLPGGDKGPARPAPPSLGNVMGNRDFVITITCFRDHVTVYPGGKQHWWKTPDGNLTDQGVFQNVQALIAGRQKAVGPGEPPYRPLIRFQVATDGLGSFLRVYPRLEVLNVPMTRENLND